MNKIIIKELRKTKRTCVNCTRKAQDKVKGNINGHKLCNYFCEDCLSKIFSLGEWK